MRFGLRDFVKSQGFIPVKGSDLSRAHAGRAP